MTTTLSPEDFAFLRDLVMKEAAIVLEPGKEYLVTSRLDPVARKESLDGIPGLVRALRMPAATKLKEAVIDAMTTNETLWFRDAHPFETLQTTIMPELIQSRANSRTIDIWCAAASTGQEPYTIAMIIKDAFPQLNGWRVRILGTDISPTALEKARDGKYSQMEMGRGLPAKYMVNYFTRQGVNYQINPNIRAMIDFKLFNLAGNWPAMGPFDLVFIRNVLIYFNQETKNQIINKAEKLVRPDGKLFLGSTESLLNISHNLERETFGKTTCYRPKA
jgi:chemotaxis protein methyltransferase CheR